MRAANARAESERVGELALVRALNGLAIDDAGALYRHALAIRERLQGRDHPELAVPVPNLATTLLAAGRPR